MWRHIPEVVGSSRHMFLDSYLNFELSPLDRFSRKWFDIYIYYLFIRSCFIYALFKLMYLYSLLLLALYTTGSFINSFVRSIIPSFIALSLLDNFENKDNKWWILTASETIWNYRRKWEQGRYTYGAFWRYLKWFGTVEIIFKQCRLPRALLPFLPFVSMYYI